jgi:hypothetical protein
MKNLYTQEQINEMRKRLYDRGPSFQKDIRHQLSDTPIEVSHDWQTSSPKNHNTTDLREGINIEEPIVVESKTEEPIEKSKRGYRKFILIGSFLIFILVALVSSLFLYFGGNQISSDSIQISMTGPSQIGGGEIVPIQITITNQNPVPVESATLILKYPEGTWSVGDSPRSVYEERIPLENISSEETRNTPVRVAVFGEENSEKIIEATIEYRVSGSNGTFYKDAEPLKVRVSSSPLVLRIDNIEKVASGQLVDITLTAVSNASSPLYNVLVTASYPNGFVYETSEPEPVYGQNVWKIGELLPEQTSTIKLKGVVNGLTEETFRINFSAGPANTDNQFLVGSVLAESIADFIIERPFIDVVIAIDGDNDRSVIIPKGKKSTVNIDIKNTLDETVYDMVVEVVPGGNALTENSIVSRGGFYDSNTDTVRWEVSNNSSFDKVLPGDSRSLGFEVTPGDNYTTASFDLVVNVYARRVAESSAIETLIGTTRAEAKYSSSVDIASQTGRNSGKFTDSGPVPPKVGETTTYTVTIVAEAGANDMVNSVVETSLPLHVNWLDSYDTEGTVTYNSVSKKIQWVIGDIPSGKQKEFSFQVGILPSISQVDSSPILLNKQNIRANDRFSGELLQDEASPVTTELSTEMGFGKGSGIVHQ